MGLRATILKSTSMYIGRCGLYPLRDDDNTVVEGEAQIAFYIGREYWGHGFATEAARAFVQHGFEQLNLRRIQAGINTNNAASLRVVEKLGFRWTRSGEGSGNRWHEFELLNPHYLS